MTTGKWREKLGLMILVKGDVSFVANVTLYVLKDSTYMDYLCTSKIKAK